MARITRAIIALGPLLVLAVLVGAAALVIASLATIARSNAWVEHTRQVIDAAEHALTLLTEAEAGQRGFLLTGRADYLEPDRATRAEVLGVIGRLQSLTADNRAQQDRAADLERTAAERMALIEQTVALRRAGRADAALAIVTSDRGRRLMERARAAVAAIRDQEEGYLAGRRAAFEAAVWRTVATTAATTGTALALLLVVASLQGRDARERERAAAALRENEARQAAILQTALDAILTIDHEGLVVEFNPAAERIFGRSRAAVLGRPLVDLVIPPSLREAHLRGLAHYLATGEGPILGRRVEVPALRADGSEFPVELAVARIPIDGPPLFTAHVRDITERKRTEEDLRASERQFRTLADSIPQLAWMAGPDGSVSWFNRRWYEYTGTTPEQMAGPDRRTLTDPDELPRVLARFRAAIARGEPWEDTFPLRRHDGAMRWHLSRALPVRDDEGRIVRWFGTNTDITERRQMEEDLRLAKEEAEAANRAKDQFLAVLSHELRTPLNPILLAVTAMLERPTDPEDLRPTLEMIRQNVHLQSRLIDDLLDVMRIVRGKMPLHWEAADGHRLIDHAVGICRSEVLGKELKLEVDLAAGRHHLNADPARLQQVFWNLVKNAIKFTPDGGAIAVRTRNEGDGGDPEGFLAIEVADTGVGIAPAVLPRIFDPFQQGDETITRRFGGLGLGLAICRGIVEAHGGTLSAASAGEGRGATFRVVLRALPPPAVAEVGAPAEDGPAAAAPAPSALKLLVVEDELATLKLMARLLRDLGHEVTTATTVAAATAAIEDGDFELIISDIGLPDGSGLDLMRRVVARRGPLPAIALTGYGMEEDIRRSRAAGFTAHLTKPIDFTKLEAMIQQVAPLRDAAAGRPRD